MNQRLSYDGQRIPELYKFIEISKYQKDISKRLKPALKILGY